MIKLHLTVPILPFVTLLLLLTLFIRSPEFLEHLPEISHIPAFSGPAHLLDRKWTDQRKKTTHLSCGTQRNPKARPNLRYDLRRLGPFRFLENYRNPCWLRQSATVCLPYFYLAGFPKCGTSDLFARIGSHPLVEYFKKEITWMTRSRFRYRGNLQSAFAAYLRQFPHREIQENWTVLKGRVFHPKIAGDGTPSTVWENCRWLLFPGNENCTEPRVGPAQYVRHLTPQAKIIVTMRNPTDRLFSDAFFRHQVRSPLEFHRAAGRAVSVFTACFQHYGVRSCVQNSTVRTQAKLFIHVGLYYTYLEDWLAVFPRDQLLFLKMEDTIADVRKWMKVIFQFLDIGVPRGNSTAYWQPPLNQGPAGQFAMLDRTRQLLDSFYRPYNARLADLLHDPRFLWQQT